MKKAIRLNVTLWVEGEADAASDFARTSKAAVREVISIGAKSHTELKVSIKKIVEVHEEDEDAAQDE